LAQFDLPLEELRAYRPARVEPDDFDAFWTATLESSRAAWTPPEFRDVDNHLRTLRTADVTYSGYGGQPIKGWLVWPAAAQAPLPTVIEYLGYGGGRGRAWSWLFWASAGYAHLVMDTRGQGATWQSGETSDIEPTGTGPQYPGVMTRGILDPATYYYRRLMTDAVLAVDAARAHPMVDPGRIAITGGSQGGGLSMAVAALASGLRAAAIDVPFLCHYKRALEVTDEMPYGEIRQFLRAQRGTEEQVFRTLSYFDGRHFAARARVPALFSVGLEDTITPPSTVFSAYNEYAGPKDIRVWSYSGHEAGQLDHAIARLDFVAEMLRA
jgi:cephalosporin-C deacetylase